MTIIAPEGLFLTDARLGLSSENDRLQRLGFGRCLSVGKLLDQFSTQRRR